MAIVQEIHASRLLEKTVIDHFGKRVGRVSDIVVQLGDDLPLVAGLLVRGKQSTLRFVPWEAIQVLVREYFSLAVGRDELPEGNPAPGGVYLARDLLDKQIVDLNGLKVRRINDIKLAEVNGALRLVAVEVGLRGLLRRLGLRKFVHFLDRVLAKRVPDFFISWLEVEPISGAPSELKLSVPHERLSKLHPADLADIIESLSRPQRSAVIAALDVDVAAEALQEIEPDVQSDILEHLTDDRAADILESMPADEAADILGELDEERSRELLEKMELEDADEVRELLEYDKKTAGRLMTTDVLSFHESLTASATIEELRRLQPEPDSAYYLYVVDQDDRLQGVVSLRDLVISPPTSLLSEIMDAHVLFVNEDDPQDEVAEVMTKYDLLGVPVVDQDGRLVGMDLIHDVVDDVYLEKDRRRRSARHA